MTRISAIGIGMLLVVLACGIGPTVVMAQGQFPQATPAPPPQYEPRVPGAQFPSPQPQKKRSTPELGLTEEDCPREGIGARCMRLDRECLNDTTIPRAECDRRVRECARQARIACARAARRPR